MLKVQCRSCGKELHGEQSRAVACGCSNMTSIQGETVSARDMGQVVLLQSDKNVKKSSLFTPQELEYQEARRKRKVRKLTFEER